MTSDSFESSLPPQNVNRKIYERLKLYFAVLTGLGGLVLFLCSDGDMTPLVAIFFATGSGPGALCQQTLMQ